MELFRAEILAKELISQYCPEVTFKWSRAKCRYGDYNYITKILRLSSVLTALRPEYEVRNTIMHEIAHALTPGNQHGRLWQIQMIKFGLSPQRCSETVADLDNLSGNWYGVCPSGHRSTTTWARKPRVIRSCGKCSPGVYNKAFNYRWVRIP